MRVTKIVREYIEESVAKKYQPAEDSIVKRYEPMERAYDEAVKAAKAEIKKVWEKSLSPFYTKEELERVRMGLSSKQEMGTGILLIVLIWHILKMPYHGGMKRVETMVRNLQKLELL